MAANGWQCAYSFTARVLESLDYPPSNYHAESGKGNTVMQSYKIRPSSHKLSGWKPLLRSCMLLLAASIGLALSGCGGGGGSTTPVDNAPATVTFTSVSSTSTSLTVNILCADPDGLVSCSYAITPNDTTTVPVYTLFANKAGGDITFTSLANGAPLLPNITYKTWARVFSFQSLLNSNGNTDFFNRFATAIVAQVPPIMGNIPNTSVANGVAMSIDASAFVTLTNGDPITAYTLGGDALPAGFSFNTSTGLLSGITTATGVYNFTMTATDNDGVSNVDNFSVSIAVSTPTITMLNQTVNDNGGAFATALPAPTVTGVLPGAVYSIVANPTGLNAVTGNPITINTTTGVVTWLGNYLSGSSINYSITIKVTNPDTGTQSVTFTLTVINNA